jgi:hypothetical protein
MIGSLLKHLTMMNENLAQRMKAELAPYLEIQDDRWRRYYDCQDDSIACGVSMQVTSNTISQIRRKYEMWQEQWDNGGRLYQEVIQTCLMDLKGNLMSDKIVSTKYGPAFLLETNGGIQWVSVAKKKETYIKKGYTLVNRVRKYSMVFSGRFTQRGNPMYSDIQIHSEEIQEWVSSEVHQAQGNWVVFCHQNPR